MTASAVTDLPQPCGREGCQGVIEVDGYCDECGHKAEPLFGGRRSDAAPDVAPEPQPDIGSTTTSTPGDSGATSAARDTGWSTTGRGRLGEGLARVPPEPGIDDPESAVLTNPTLPESKRFCSNGHPVGRARGVEPGRVRGFCPKDREPFDFEPKLRAGDVVGNQYEVVGCLAHGGLGWVYLARDRAVSLRLVVLKGLLNAGDALGREVAWGERDALAQMHQPNIVEIYNFLEHEGAEYIVMEYVNGRSLKQKLDQRREANGGRAHPFAVDQAIDYVLAVLPAFTYLHERSLVYCDFKPDNVIQVGNRVKLIDLGAVRRFDVTSGDSFGTPGYQAPEIAEDGVSVASDLYTVGRTLAVLAMDFRHQGKLEYALPDPADQPVLAQFDSFRRFVLKATATDPARRFQSAGDMRDQLLGVLHEVVALTTGQPQPAAPAAFALPPDDGALPPAAIDPADPAATFLANLSADGPAAVLEEIGAAATAGQVPESLEVHLRRARALIDLERIDEAKAILRQVRDSGGATWRVAWLHGIASLGTSPEKAVKAFDLCMSEVPGELAPKLGAALALKETGEIQKAAGLFSVVTSVDPSYVAAAHGLAECRVSQGRIDDAIAALDAIPRTHRDSRAAQIKAVKILIAAGRYDSAWSRLDSLSLDQLRRLELELKLLEAALASLTNGDAPATKVVTLGGGALDERAVRRRLEKALRRVARFTPDADDRCRIVDRANTVRPVTLL